MKCVKFGFLVALLSAMSFGQTGPVSYPPVPAVNSQAASSAGPAGTVTNTGTTVIAVTPGPLLCNGTSSYIHNVTFTLAINTTYQVINNCDFNTVYVRSDRSAAVPAEVNLATVVCGATTCGTITDTRSASNFPNMSDGYFWVSESACSGATTGTTGSGNATDILAGSGGLRVYRLSATAASSSANTFTCQFSPPSRLTTGKGITINDIVFLVSTQTTQPTTITLPTLKSFVAPVAVDPETANSATFVTAGGTVTQTPTSTQFAAYTAVAAGQFFTVKASLGTPIAANTDLQVFQFVIVFNQSASAISIQETPGFFVHYTNIPL